jgi:DNA repair protein RadC
LSDEDLLAVVLRTGYAGCSALDLARGLVREHPDGALGRVAFADLRRLKGVGPSRAAVLSAAFELARRWDPGRTDAFPPLDSPARVCERLFFLRDKRKEHLVALYLDARSRLLHQETVSIGTLTASLVHPREVYSPAVERGAAGVIVAHNHPSGDPSPSCEDREATRRLCAAGRILGIPLLDHILVASGGTFSFREHGLLEDRA